MQRRQASGIGPSSTKGEQEWMHNFDLKTQRKYDIEMYLREVVLKMYTGFSWSSV
jgi:hypothetical protein